MKLNVARELYYISKLEEEKKHSAIDLGMSLVRECSLLTVYTLRGGGHTYIFNQT